MWSSPGTWIIWTNTNTLIISIKILKFSKGSTQYNCVNESYLIDFPLRWQEMLSPSTGPRSQWCPPDLSAMLSSSKILHFYTVFLLWGGIWVTIIKHTFVLKSLLEEHVFDRKVNNCWLRAGSGKPDSLSVPVVSSSPHSWRWLQELATGIPSCSTLLCCFYLRVSIPGSLSVCYQLRFAGLVLLMLTFSQKVVLSINHLLCPFHVTYSETTITQASQHMKGTGEVTYSLVIEL